MIVKVEAEVAGSAWRGAAAYDGDNLIWHGEVVTKDDEKIGDIITFHAPTVYDLNQEMATSIAEHLLFVNKVRS